MFAKITQRPLTANRQSVRLGGDASAAHGRSTWVVLREANLKQRQRQAAAAQRSTHRK